jgi:aldehyde dehydrogenase (NAD+)
MNISSPIKHPDRLFIGGKWVTSSTESKIDVISCVTETLFASVADAREADVDRAVASARAAFDSGPWPLMPPSERAEYLEAIGAELDKLAEEGALIWTSESGVVHDMAKIRMQGLSGFYRYYADLATTFPFQERHTPQAGNVGLLVREPVGVVAAIIPWNAPPSTIAAKCAPALLAGCAIILKASPEAPGAAYLFAEACEKAGLPAGVLNMLTADRQTSEHLVRHNGVDKVSFTGSTAAGRRIASICGERVARCTLELGGKSAAIVLDDFEVETAARTIADRAKFLSGQVCSSLTRIVIPRARHDAMLDALSYHFGRVNVADPFLPGCEMGPLATRHHRSRVEGYIERGLAEGATLATGGGRPEGLERGFFIEPTVFGHVDNGSTIAREEILGPELSVIPAESEADAVRIANDSIFGLNASVFTNDVERAYAVARQIRSGTVGQNSFRSDFTIAFGGFKQSGFGREGGKEGLLAYLESKTLILDSMPASAGAVGS